MDESKANSGITERDGHHLPPGECLALKQHPDQQSQGRIGKQDQPLQARRDVFQSPEIQNAGPVIAQTTQQKQTPPVAGLYGFRCPLTGNAKPEENRQRKSHAQGQQGNGINPIRVSEFDENGFQGKPKGRQQGQSGTISIHFFQSRPPVDLNAGTQTPTRLSRIIAVNLPPGPKTLSRAS